MTTQVSVGFAIISSIGRQGTPNKKTNRRVFALRTIHCCTLVASNDVLWGKLCRKWS
jgi:hypothetical protein